VSAVGEPLAGCVMVVTADRRKTELATALARRGAIVKHAPALSTIPQLDDPELIAQTRKLIAAPPDVVVATTGIGFRGWVEAADTAGLADDLIAALSGARLVARGPKARGAIQAAGLETDWVAESETAAEVRDYLIAEGIKGLSIAIQHHGNGSDGLDEAFTAAGASVRALRVYGYGGPPEPELHREWVMQAAWGGADAVLFTSAPGAQSWIETAFAEGVQAAIAQRSASQELVVAAVGPVTAAPLIEAGFTVKYPDRSRMGALVRMLVQDFTDSAGGIPTPHGRLVMRAGAAVLDGRVLPLTPTGLELLRALARACGNVLSREELALILPGPDATPHAVEAAINRLRETSGAPGIVRTVVKRGYALAVNLA
jgi:uroporphyrinogen-III synthase